MKNILFILLTLLIVQSMVEAKHKFHRHRLARKYHMRYIKGAHKNFQQKHKYSRQRFMQKKCAPDPVAPPEDPKYHTLCPSEYETRIMVAIVNTMEYDFTVGGGYKQTDYVESLEHNRVYKCMVARHVYFTAKMLLYTFQFIVNNVSEYFPEKFQLQPVVQLFDQIRVSSYKILALGLDQTCHQTEPFTQAIFQKDSEAEYNKLNKAKVQMLDFMPKLIYLLMRHKFKDTTTKNPTDTKGFYEDIEDMLNQLNKSPEQKSIWKSLFVDLTDTHEDLKENLADGKPILMSKKFGSIFYDRQKKFYEQLRTFTFQQLTLKDDEKFTFKRTLLVLDVMAALQLSIVSWPYYFKGPLKAQTCSSEKKEIDNEFAYATKNLWSFKTCGIMTQQMESVRIFENLIIDMEGITCKDIMYDKYVQIAKEVQQKVCFSESESCLSNIITGAKDEGLETKEEEEQAGAVENKGANTFMQLQYQSRKNKKYGKKSYLTKKANDAAKKEEHDDKDPSFKGLDIFLNRIQSCFFRQLSALRKHGPITDLFITRENTANALLIKMGYQSVRLTELTGTNTLWYCRMCGGGMAVSKLQLVDLNLPSNMPPTSDVDFQQPVEAQPNTSVIKMKITETHYLQITKSLLESELSNQQEGEFLSGIYSDESEKNFPVEQTTQELKPIQMFYSMHKWNLSDRKWTQYPTDVMAPVTTLEESKSPTMVVYVEDYCPILRDLYKGQAFLVQRWKGAELWTMSQDVLKQLKEAISSGHADPVQANNDGVQDLGANPNADAGTKCEVKFESELKPFSYFTLGTDKDKIDAMKQIKSGDWSFNKSPATSLKTEGAEPKVIPQWIIARRFFALPQPTTASQKEPNEIQIRSIEVISNKLASGICTPVAPPCTFIEDSFLPAQNAVDVDILEAVGCAGEEEKPDGKCAPLIDELKMGDETTLEELNEKYGEILGRKIPETLESDAGKTLMKTSDAGCKFTQTFKVKSSCEDKYLYLVRDNKNAIREYCVDDLTNEDVLKTIEQFPPESVIPIQTSYFAILKVTNDDFNVPDTVYRQANIANWLRTVSVPLKGRIPVKVTIRFVVEINLLVMHYIGIPDEYSDEGYCNNFVFGDKTHTQFRNWNRYIPANTDDLFDDDFTLRVYEKSLMFSIQAQKLADVKAVLGVGEPTTDTWKTNLQRNTCKKARVFIPIDWSGGSDPDCKVKKEDEDDGIDLDAPLPNVVKNVRVTQEDGVREFCDGSQMAVVDTYYLEVVVQSEVDTQYHLPSEAEIKLAKAHGYLMQDAFESYEYAANGYNSKVRVWVKPDTTGFSTRFLICRDTPFKTGIRFKVSYD